MPEATENNRERASWQRAAVVITLVSLVLLSLWLAPALVFNLGVVAVVVLAAHEFYSLDSSICRHRLYRWAGMGGAGLLALQMIAFPVAGAGVSIPLLVMLIFAIVVLHTKGPDSAEFYEVLVVMFGVLYSGGMFGQLILIRNATAGRELTTVLLLTVLAREVGAHWGGSLFPSGRLLNRSINAKKSYRGAAVGIAGAVGASVLLSRYLSVNFTIFKAVVFGGCIGVACQFGDLSESYMKRVARRRHSGKLLGPEGGVLDFLDAVTFAIVVVRLLLLVWGYSR